MGEPDPKYWKKITYSTGWPKHKKEVLKLKTKLEENFPELKNAIKSGLGADSDEWLKIPPDDKAEGDLHLHKDYKKFCIIEVSGSDKKEIKGDDAIWVRPDKFEMGKKQSAGGMQYFFYMVYPNATYVLTTEDIEPYKDDVGTYHLKGPAEKYINIPCKVACTETDMFTKIKEKLE